MIRLEDTGELPTSITSTDELPPIPLLRSLADKNGLGISIFTVVVVNDHVGAVVERLRERIAAAEKPTGAR